MVQRVIGDKIINNGTRGLENNPPLSGTSTAAAAGFVIKTKLRNRFRITKHCLSSVPRDPNG